MKHPSLFRYALLAAALCVCSLAPSVPAQAAPAAASPFSEYSPAQQTKLKARNERFVKEVNALRDNKKMTDAQKQARFTEMKAAVEKDMLAILTPEQRAKVVQRKAINDQFQKDLMGLRSDTKMTDVQKKAKFETLMKARQEALLATLPPAQRTLIEKNQQAEMARAKEVQQLGEEIQKSETPAQLKKIKAISAAARQKEQALMADTTLSNPAKETRLEALRHQAQVQIDALLTPAQRTKFARMRAMVSAPSAR